MRFSHLTLDAVKAVHAEVLAAYGGSPGHARKGPPGIWCGHEKAHRNFELGECPYLEQKVDVEAEPLAEVWAQFATN